MLTRTSSRSDARSSATARCSLILAVSVALLAGCGSLPGSGDDRSTVDVWLMKGSLTAEFTEDFVRDFEDRNPGVRADITVHEWPGINKKVRKAIDSGDGPDVIEVGNTQVAEYVDAGGVRNFTTKVVDLGGTDWIDGLSDSGQIEGFQFGIPFYSANRVVIYRKDLFDRAGISTPPKTREEWLAATKQLDQQQGQQGIYLPGRNWYVLAGFIWDEGGSIAMEHSGNWAGDLHSPEARRGMDFYARLQSYGDARPDSDEAKPDELDVFANGEIAQLIAVPGSAKLIAEANPALKDKLGFFPIPGKKAGAPGSVFAGGSVLIMPEKSDEQDAGYEFIKLLTSDGWQRRMAKTMDVVPNKSTLTGALKSEPGAAAMAKAAEQGHATPASPRWGDLETRNPLKAYQTAVLRGADPAAAAQDASNEITRLLSDSSP